MLSHLNHPLTTQAFGMQPHSANAVRELAQWVVDVCQQAATPPATTSTSTGISSSNSIDTRSKL